MSVKNIGFEIHDKNTGATVFEFVYNGESFSLKGDIKNLGTEDVELITDKMSKFVKNASASLESFNIEKIDQY